MQGINIKKATLTATVVTFDTAQQAFPALQQGKSVAFLAPQINNLVLTEPVQVYALLDLTYFVICYSLSRAALHLERRLSR